MFTGGVRRDAMRPVGGHVWQVWRSALGTSISRNVYNAYVLAALIGTRDCSGRGDTGVGRITDHDAYSML